jgi:hypothetical protein
VLSIIVGYVNGLPLTIHQLWCAPYMTMIITSCNLMEILTKIRNLRNRLCAICRVILGYWINAYLEFKQNASVPKSWMRILPYNPSPRRMGSNFISTLYQLCIKVDTKLLQNVVHIELIQSVREEKTIDVINVPIKNNKRVCNEFFSKRL